MTNGEHMDIRANLEEVEQRIQAACARAGRDRGEVTLIAVSKTKPVELLMDAYSAGIRDFGENKVQELCGKMEALPADIRWHMIGHLQTNKVKYIAAKTALIHSVDSLRLAEEIERQAAKLDTVVPILIEVNAAQEASKFGAKKEEVSALVRAAAALPHIEVRGLMTVPPIAENPEDNRACFREIRQLSVDIAEENIDNVSMNILSYGMTGDYETAIEEGATMVRVGTGIFGARSYAR